MNASALVLPDLNGSDLRSQTSCNIGILLWENNGAPFSRYGKYLQCTFLPSIKLQKKLKPKRNKAVAINFISMHTDNAFTPILDVKLAFGSHKMSVLHPVFSSIENFDLASSLCRDQRSHIEDVP